MITEQNLRNAQQLIADIDRKIADWDEYHCFTLHGVKNLPMATMENLKLYAEHLLTNGSFYGLMKPLGENMQVLERAGVIPQGYAWPGF